MNVKSIAGKLGERRARFALSSSVGPLAGYRTVSDFVALTKPRVMMLAVFTALVGLGSAPSRLDPLITFAAVLAIAAGAGAAGVLNMWYDADIDAVMSHTSMRPVSSLRYRSRSQSGYGHYSPHCYFPEEWPKLPPWPPFCN